MRDLFWISMLWFTLIPLAAASCTSWLRDSGRRRLRMWAWFAVAVGCALQLTAGIGAISGTQSAHLADLPGIPPFGRWTFTLDPLAGLMLALLGLIGLVASVYAAGMTLRDTEKQAGPGTGLLMASIVALQFVFTGFLTTATNALPMLIAWEGMSLCAFAYVLANHVARRARRSAFVTLAISEVGFLALIIACLLAASTSGSLIFANIHATLSHSSSGRISAVFALALFGFGVKSGVLPGQLWMPRAYEAAPPHLNAILAGGLLNLGLFGILRVYEWIGRLPTAWGVGVVLLGAIAVFLGALFAVFEHRLAKILAYSSIENVGFMLIGLGLAISFVGTGQRTFAGVALTAMMVQMVSHALAKALCFLASGEVTNRTGCSDLDALGGLFKTMPVIALGLLIGCLTLAAVAPFSGFAAEWLTFQSMMQVYRSLPGVDQVLVMLAGSITAVGAALAFTTFLRLFAFLATGRPRTVQGSATDQGTRKSVLIAIGTSSLAIVSALYGFFPTSAIAGLDHIVASLPSHVSVLGIVVPNVIADPSHNTLLASLGGALFSFLPLRGAVIQPAAGFSSIAPTYLLWWFIVFALLAYVLRAGISRRKSPWRPRAVPAWHGGYADLPASAQYVATAYSNPYRMYWSRLLRFEVRRAVTSGTATLPLHISVKTDFTPWLQESIYTSVTRGFRRTIAFIQHVQHGYLWGYLTVMLIGILALLGWAFIA